MSYSYDSSKSRFRERERELKVLPYKPSNKSDKGFTLVELLIVISILAALAAAVVVVINPAEMLRQGRDSTRMREIGTLHRAISMLRIDTPAAPLGSPNTIHVSIPDTSETCANLGLPTPPPGWVYRCVSATNLRNINNTGWIPIDFTIMPRGSPLASLPVDPVNTVASSNFYVFVTDGRTWTLASLMESERHAPSAARDGGTDAARFEAGTNLSLWTSASGLVGYWSFDEGAGTTARDLSGRGNTGTLVNNPTWTTGRVAGGLSFDGVNDFVRVLHSPSLNIANNVTVEAWVKSNADRTYQIIGKNTMFFATGARGWHISTANNPADLIWEVQDGVGRWSTRFLTGRLFSWIHIVATRDGNIIRTYTNGILRAQATVGGTMESVDDLFIGSFMGASQFFHGLIDEVRIYNRALTEAEIRTIFNATR